jgi:flavin reductase (DIM6/NTAB) family NADH-FMN oxidoreductase RutF
MTAALALAPAPAAAAADFVTAMAAAVTTVSIVTTDGPGGRAGRTVSATASVSAEPPLLLACVNRRSPLVGQIRRNGVFAVNTLGAHQQALADTFAGGRHTGEPHDFSAARWETAITGSPLLGGAAARFDCVVETTVEAGSHTIFIGRVLRAEVGEAPALAYTRRSYAVAKPSPAPPAAPATPPTRPPESLRPAAARQHRRP